MIFAAVLATFDGKQLSSAAGPSAGVAIATFAALTLGFQNVEASDAREDVELPYVVRRTAWWVEGFSVETY